MSEMISRLKDWRWPDAWLAMFGTAIVPVSGFAAADPVPIKLSILMTLFGLVLFGLGGKIAHYIERDKTLPSNVWFSKWRHGLMQNIFASVGLVLTVVGFAFVVILTVSKV